MAAAILLMVDGAHFHNRQGDDTVTAIHKTNLVETLLQEGCFS